MYVNIPLQVSKFIEAQTKEMTHNKRIYLCIILCVSLCVCVCVCVWMSISSHQKNSFNLFFEPPHLAATPLGGRHKFINRRPIETKFTRGDTNLYCFKQMCNCLRNLGIVTSYI